MSKISISFLFGFVALSAAGAASAQSPSEAAAAMSNNLSPQVQSLDGVRSEAKLGMTSEANPYAMAASAMHEAPRGMEIDVPTVKAKIGGGARVDLPNNALADTSQSASTNMANALQSAQPAGSGSLQSLVVLGTATPDMSNAIGEDMQSRLRLGQ